MSADKDSQFIVRG